MAEHISLRSLWTLKIVQFMFEWVCVLNILSQLHIVQLCISQAIHVFMFPIVLCMKLNVCCTVFINTCNNWITMNLELPKRHYCKLCHIYHSSYTCTNTYYDLMWMKWNVCSKVFINICNNWINMNLDMNNPWESYPNKNTTFMTLSFELVTF